MYNYDCDLDYQDTNPYRLTDQEFYNACDFLEGVQEAIYETGDIESLENCIQELCAILDCDFLGAKKEKPKLKRSNDLMEWYLGYQRAHLDQINGNKRTVESYQLEKYDSNLKKRLNY